METYSEKIKLIAQVCHEANRAWCAAHGDLSQADWHSAEYWQKEAAYKGIEFRINNPHSHHSVQHEAWLAVKQNDGWVYGEIKDPVAKTHPSIVPYEELPEFEKKKDALFCAIVDALK